MDAVILQSKNGVNCIELALWIWTRLSEISRSKVQRMSDKTEDCSERTGEAGKNSKNRNDWGEFLWAKSKNYDVFGFFLLCVMATKAPLVQYHFYNGWVFRVAGSMQVAENSDFWSGEATQYSNLTKGKLFGFIDWMCSRFYMFSVTLFCWGSPLFARAFVVSVYGTLYTWGSMFCMVCTCRFRCMVSSLCFTRYVSVGLVTAWTWHATYSSFTKTDMWQMLTFFCN